MIPLSCELGHLLRVSLAVRWSIAQTSGQVHRQGCFLPCRTGFVPVRWLTSPSWGIQRAPVPQGAAGVENRDVLVSSRWERSRGGRLGLSHTSLSGLFPAGQGPSVRDGWRDEEGRRGLR